MKKRLLLLALCAAGLLTVASCGDKSGVDSNTNTNNNTQETEGESNSSTEANNDTLYQIRALYPDGTECKEFFGQWCNSTACYPPMEAADGVAKKNIKTDEDLLVHILNYPEGYTYNFNAYKATKDNREVTIQLVDLKAPTAGDGTKANPYQIGAHGFSVLDYQKDSVLEYEFTAPEAGSYTIESVAKYFNETVKNDPDMKIYDLSNPDDKGKIVTDGGFGTTNFKYTFEAAKNQKFRIQILAEAGGDVNNKEYPFDFDVIISLNK